MHWLPVDIAARLVIPLLDLNCNNDPVGYFHLQNPDETSWSEVVDAMACKFPALQRVPFPEWLRALEASFGPDMPLTLPALKLFNYLTSKLSSEATMKMEVAKTLRFAPSMNFGPINAGLMQKYITVSSVATQM